MENYSKIDSYLDSHLDESINELADLVAQPSVAAQNWGLEETAQKVVEMLAARGFSAEILPSGGAPVVFAECSGRNPERTLIFYNHYDVQPGEPLELWDSPPFEPEIRDEKLFGRGVSDDKGHFVSRLFAIDALLNEDGDLPCNVKFVVEGEEEIGSLNLPDFIKEHEQKLAADACIWEFGSVDHRDVPMQYLGMRGICYVELSVQTANMDIHSGLGGSIIENAAWRLVWALSSLKDSDEKVLIPGFYDSILPPTERDLDLFKALPEVADEYKSRYGVNKFLKGLTGGVELKVAETFEPTCTICGLISGYQGEGTKTVLPALASAKVDFRLVPNQTPSRVVKQLRAYLDENGFSDINIKFLGGEPPARTDPDDPFVQLVIDTSIDVYRSPMVPVPMVGGSGPNHAFIHALNLPVATAGVGYPGSNVHAPNENIRLDLYLMGSKHIARILKEFGKK